MTRPTLAFLLGVCIMNGLPADATPASGPLRVCPDNPRYFADPSGEAVLLVGSHVWNNLQDIGPTDPPAPFDWDAYVDWMAALNHNFIRLWRWELVEWDTRANHEQQPRHHLCSPHPWLRTGPGEALDGKPRFDLSRFDEGYFARLRERVRSAGDKGIYVSIMLFEGWGLQCVPRAWEAHPFHPENNVNGVGGSLSGGKPPGIGVHELLDPAVTALQEAYVRKVIDTVNDLDNVLYEISNENHPPSTQWQYHMIDLIHEYERGKPKQHPVGMTFQYQGGRNQTLFDSPANWISPNPDGGYSSDPPAADGSKVIITDTDHLWGIGGNKEWVWKSVCRGLNPIFMDPYDGKVLGSAFDPRHDPVRRNMGYALRLSRQVRLTDLRPWNQGCSTAYCLANPGQEYLAYLPGGAQATLDLSGAEGTFATQWLDPATGTTATGAPLEGGGIRPVAAPFADDAVLLVKRAETREVRHLELAPPEPIEGDFRLRVSDNQRHLIDHRGRPFFWLGDTGWKMLVSLTEDETEAYLEDRRAKGFNVVQCILALWNADLQRNRAGELPFLNGNPAIPNEKYFAHVDAAFEIARRKGIVLALLPAWGELVVDRRTVTQGNARAYGRWLGERYRDTPNLVWVLGGDQPPTGVEDVYQELAAGLAEGDGGRHLMTYHPHGWQRSSQFWHNADWLDFNMIQSGHSWDAPNYAMILADYALSPAKPTLDAEPRYEHITDGLSRDPATRRISAHQVRKAAYNAVLSGALGHTYGCSEVYRFWQPGDPESVWGADTPWQEAIHFQGALHMGYLKALMLSLPWHALVPEPSLIPVGQGREGAYVPAAVSQDGQVALAYLPEYRAVTVDARLVTGAGVRASWFDPRTATLIPAGEHPNSGPLTFVPPVGAPDPDYVLILESSGPDETPPAVERVVAVAQPGRVAVIFSEPLDEASATQPGNYTVTAAGTGEPVALAHPELSTDRRTVRLDAAGLVAAAGYELRVANVRDRAGNAAEPGTVAAFQARRPGASGSAGMLAQYLFAEGEGDTVGDSSGSPVGLDLRIRDLTCVEWTAEGLRIAKPVLLDSDAPASGIVDACRQSNSLTVEAWITPASEEQTGPARIVSLSRDTGARNFTLGQSGKSYAARLRTTSTSTNGLPELVSPPARPVTRPAHVVFVREPSGQTHLYVNGAEQATGFAAGDFGNWDGEYRLMLANEATGDRPWLGTLHAVRLYSRALDEFEVLELFLAGQRDAQE